MISTAFVNCDAETVYSSNYGYRIVRECDEITESVMKAIHDYETHLDNANQQLHGRIRGEQFPALYHPALARQNLC